MDEASERADQVIRDIRRFLEFSPEIEVRDDLDLEKRAHLLVAHGWWVRAVRTADAIRCLREHGLDHECGPLLRTLIRHSIAIIWLSNDRGAAFEAFHYREMTSKKFRPGAISELVPASYRLDESSVPGSIGLLKSFQNLCEHVAADNGFVPYTTMAYEAYRAEWSTTRPSLASAEPYLSSSDRGVRLLSGPASDPTPLERSAIFALAATKAYLEFVVQTGGEELIEGAEALLLL